MTRTKFEIKINDDSFVGIKPAIVPGTISICCVCRNEFMNESLTVYIIKDNVLGNVCYRCLIKALIENDLALLVG